MQSIDASRPIRTARQVVQKDWCDYNGHMNVAYYSLAFENANFEAQEIMGMGEAYVNDRRLSLFTMKNIFTYVQSVEMGDPLNIVYRVRDYSPKLLHVLLEMTHANDGFLSCFTEQLVAHVDMDAGRAVPMSDAQLAMLEEFRLAQADLPVPRGLGEAIAIVKK